MLCILSRTNETEHSSTCLYTLWKQSVGVAMNTMVTGPLQCPKIRRENSCLCWIWCTKKARRCRCEPISSGAVMRLLHRWETGEQAGVCSRHWNRLRTMVTFPSVGEVVKSRESEVIFGISMDYYWLYPMWWFHKRRSRQPGTFQSSRCDSCSVRISGHIVRK